MNLNIWSRHRYIEIGSWCTLNFNVVSGTCHPTDYMICTPDFDIDEEQFDIGIEITRMADKLYASWQFFTGCFTCWMLCWYFYLSDYAGANHASLLSRLLYYGKVILSHLFLQDRMTFHRNRIEYILWHFAWYILNIMVASRFHCIIREIHTPVVAKWRLSNFPNCSWLCKNKFGSWIINYYIIVRIQAIILRIQGMKSNGLHGITQLHYIWQYSHSGAIRVIKWWLDQFCTGKWGCWDDRIMGLNILMAIYAFVWLAGKLEYRYYKRNCWINVSLDCKNYYII